MDILTIYSTLFSRLKQNTYNTMFVKSYQSGDEVQGRGS